MSSITEETLENKVANAIAKNPGQMTPVLAKQFGVTEAEVIRAHPAELSTELDSARIEEIIQSLDQLGLVHVICSNGVTVLEAYGHFGGFSKSGPFLNVQTKDLDMHIRHGEIKAAFALIKPSHADGQKTYSIQFYQENGTSAFKVFLYKSMAELGKEELEKKISAWEEMKAKFTLGA